MNSNKFGPFIVEKARGGGFQVRNIETGSTTWQRNIKEARVAAHASMMRAQDRQRQAAS